MALLLTLSPLAAVLSTARYERCIVIIAVASVQDRGVGSFKNKTAEITNLASSLCTTRDGI